MNMDLDTRTRLLLRARTINGVAMNVDREHEVDAMNQMVEEGLFRHSTSFGSYGYWWTREGEQAAEQAWEQAPVERFETSYRDHPQVKFELNGLKEELCYVTCASREKPLWVREVVGRYLVDHPNGMENKSFDSADEAIAWAITA
jgi:hypothetical protein